jgi:hypothetical protein
MKNRWNDNDKGKPIYSKKILVQVPLCPPQIPHGLVSHWIQASAVKRPATNRLVHGTARKDKWNADVLQRNYSCLVQEIQGA